MRVWVPYSKLDFFLAALPTPFWKPKLDLRVKKPQAALSLKQAPRNAHPPPHVVFHQGDTSNPTPKASPVTATFVGPSRPAAAVRSLVVAVEACPARFEEGTR